MRKISLDELPQKFRLAIQRYLKQNRRALTAVSDVKFGLEGVKWVVSDLRGRPGFGTSPVAALRRFDRTNV